MKTVLVLAALVAIALGGTVSHHGHEEIKTKPVDKAFVEKQKKILSLFYDVEQVDTKAEYYQVASKYDIEANIDKYTNKKAVEDFLYMYRAGVLPKYHTFSIFYDNLRVEAIALYKLFFFAKDFDTFYNTAAWARVYLNEGIFLYSYYIAVLQREDTKGFVLPAPYEVYPEMFTNKAQVYGISRTKQQGSLKHPEFLAQYGIVVEDNDFIFYANYSNSLTYPNDEQRISYFTEDIGLNSFYYYFHAEMPFWMNANKYGSFKERRGEGYFFFYQQLLARYYLERLSNGLGEIPAFSWYSPIVNGYYPNMGTWKYPFAQRSNHFLVHSEKNYEAVRFLDIFEKTFFQYLQKGHFKAFSQEIDFHSTKAMNFVGNYWQTNADLFGEEFTETYQRSYEATARRVLGAAPASFDEYNFMPSALDFYQTSLRDPAFYQLYNKIFDYMVQYKAYLKPYTQDDLHFAGVKINDVKVDKMVTYFDLYDFDALNMVIRDNQKEVTQGFKIRQPRLNHKAFTVTIDVKSDVATDASFKIWIGPKYDSNGYPIAIENNWQNFFELDMFSHKLVPGINKIERSSEEFFWFKEDSLPISEIQHLLDEGKLPVDMSEEYSSMPERLMLPKGTKGGMPYQIFVYVYNHNSVSKEVTDKLEYLSQMLDGKPFGYPFDRPAHAINFKQPNMFFEDVLVYHEGEEHAYKYANPTYKPKEL